MIQTFKLIVRVEIQGGSILKKIILNSHSQKAKVLGIN